MTARPLLPLAAAALLAAGLLAACGGSGPREAASPAASQFTFTDDRGERVSLPRRPRRVAAYEAPAAALWYLGIKPVAIFGSPSLTASPLLEGVDVTGVESLGEVYGEVNLERLAALAPDLIVTAFNPRDPGLLWGFKDADQQRKAQAIAPIVAIDGTRDPTAVIERFRELAGALGADVDAPALRAARERFDAAVAQLRAATAAKPGLRAVALGGFGEELYFAKPAAFPALRQFQQWGLDLAEPAGGANPFWEVTSWEEADRYPADLILYDTRAGALPLEELERKPTWRQLPAVRAGQLVAWQGQEDWSYQLYARDVERLAAAVRQARAGLVP